MSNKAKVRLFSETKFKKKAYRDFKKPRKSIQGVQIQNDKTAIQESKEREKKKVSIRRYNDCKLIIFTD